MSFGIQHIWEASKNPFIYLNKSAGPQVQVEINYIQLYYEHSKACSKLKKKRKKRVGDNRKGGNILKTNLGKNNFEILVYF